MKLAFALATTLVAASAGRAFAAPAPWCGQGVDEQFNVTEPNGRFKYNTDVDDLADERGLDAIVGASCSTMMRDDQARYHAQLEAARARWSKRMHMTDADWADAGEWIRENASMRYFAGMVMKLDARATFSRLGPVAQFAALDPPMIATDKDPRYKSDYAADALGSRLTQAGIAGYVSSCLEQDPAGGIDAPRWAMCWPDVDAIDLDKLAVELRSSKDSTGGDRMRLRLVAADLVDKRLPEARKELADAEQHDASIAKLFEVAANARKAWRAQATALQAALELQDRLDDAVIENSRSGVAGCAITARAEFDAVVKATPVASFGDLGLKKQDDGRFAPNYGNAIAAVTHTPAGYLAALSMLSCAWISNAKLAVAPALFAGIGHVSLRGERTAAMMAMKLSGIVSDERGKTFEFHLDAAPTWLRIDDEAEDGGGRITRLTKSGDRVHVEFAAVMEKQTDCMKPVRTNHITAIRDDGTLVYEYTCAQYQSQMVNVASGPIDVDATDAATLKVGMIMHYGDGVLLAWNKAGDKAPALVFGVPVK
ncbi:MAG TPA: hypothetical protein VH143_04445 [Kofleriaceae bacterium]|nr:hypothetical protein [Kofleriaceae bacterium]